MKIYEKIFFYFLICFVFIFYSSVSTRAEVGYFEIKRSLSNDFISEIEFIIRMKKALMQNGVGEEELFDFEPLNLSQLSLNFKDGQMVDVAGSLPLTSCGGSSGYLTNFVDDVGSADGLRQAAVTVLEVKGALQAYGIDESDWNEYLIDMEADLRMHLIQLSSVEKRQQYMLASVSIFAGKVSQVYSALYGSKITLAATHGCGGGLYSVPVVVQPEGDHLELISAVYFEDCQNSGLSPRCNNQGVIDIYSPGGEYGLSGIYYYRVNNDSNGYKTININKRKRHILSLIGTASASENGIFGDYMLCFKNGVLQTQCEADF